MKLDILVFAAHPDDAELTCSGTILHHIHLGYKVGIIDLTKGELGSRGTAQTRAEESAVATKIMGIHHRENLGLPDGFLQNIPEYQLKLVEKIRQFQPQIILANALQDRHTDHAKGAILAKEASFLSGLKKIETYQNNVLQEAFRPQSVYHYIQDIHLKPDFVVDISAYWHKRVEAIKAFKTQFFTGETLENEPVTPISTPQFMHFLEGRAREMGRMIGVEFGEGFNVNRPLGIGSLFQIH
ncbi:MAG: bacillithiol biosynthesis deacetylase BshB1 [Bacteroidetes bacterium]|nr:MAG: bacillithiol biosynthesis deacetylase BshB1 [Bacteroidota bacterium]TAG89005.1 MAG: bacillithiol biosynthesis deacetylase BshB1 [Bacteroidota bacterium]